MNTIKIACSILMCLLSISSWAKKPIRVACIGNSITFGYKLDNPNTESYPAQLQQMLGDGYKIGNFGKSGATLLYNGHRPYVAQTEFQSALAFSPEIAVIHLGINDTDPRNWPNYKENFVRDYISLIDSFRLVNPSVKIFIAKLSPIKSTHSRFKSGTRDWHRDIQKAIEVIARVTEVALIDFHTPLYHYPMMLPDALHPNKEGAEKLAKTVYSAITGDYGGLRMSDIYGDKMVLPHGKEFTIRGQANANEKVSIQLDRKKWHTFANDRGKWETNIPVLNAGSRYTLKLSTSNKTLQYKDIIAGDIWLCSGQSNMAWMMKQIGNTEHLEQDEHIRLYNMKGRWSNKAQNWDTCIYDSMNNLCYFEHTEWTYSNNKSIPNFSAIGYHFAKQLKDSLSIPIGIICNAIGGSPTEAWVERSALEFHFPDILANWYANDYVQDWVRNNGYAKVNKHVRHPFEPTYLFESGIYCLEKFPIKGVLWYQGESNAHNVLAHNTLFSLLVSSWRSFFNQQHLPFYYVQLSSMNRPSWPEFRNSQRELLAKIPNIHMVVSSDVGDSTNVHPKKKKPVAERLVYSVLSHSYGYKHILPSGPLYKDVSFKDTVAFVSFDYADGLRSSDGAALRCFEVAEYAGLFFPAVATIVNNQVKVYSPQVKNPRYVRYAWQPFTRANLVNVLGLPASTFSTPLNSEL
ncbi:MAG: GDSL-type esterase/lipase family protein [Bacteroidales bacterium]